MDNLDANDLVALRKSLLGIEGYTNIISDVNGDKIGDIRDLVRLKLLVSEKKIKMNNEYILVWGDEFNSGSLDNSKWTFADRMPAYSDMATLTSDDVAKVTTDSNGTGILRMTAYKSSSGKFKTTKSVTTYKTMDYMYGYLEMRAKVPTGQGVWPSLWLSSNQRSYNTTIVDGIAAYDKYNYTTEVDVFEVFADNYALPNIHKWWKEGTAEYDKLISNGGDCREQYNGYKQADNVYKQSNKVDISDGGWHTYGMLWTPDEISMYFDGVKYQTYNMNENFGHGDMEGFKQPLSIIINNHLFTPGYVASEGGKWAYDHEMNPATFTEAIYDIDYIRLYQRPDIGEIYYIK